MTTETKLVPISDLMTEDEIEQFKSDDWGNAAEAVQRGVQFLDREVPGWRDRVEVQTLELSSACRCVLGQVFETEARDADITDVEDGFNFGYMKFGLNVTSTGVPLDEDGASSYDAASFFGFDFTDTYSYTDLNIGWKAALA